MQASEFPEPVRRAFWDANAEPLPLVIGGNATKWFPIDELDNFPNEAGVYAIGLKLGVQYERMTSRIIYFGSTAKLRNRISSYSDGGHNWHLRRLAQRYPGGLVASFHALPGFELKWRRVIEDAAMQVARVQFGCFPVCNVDAIESTYRSTFCELVRVEACEGLSFPQSVADLRRQLKSETIGQLRQFDTEAYLAAVAQPPTIRSTGITVTYSVSATNDVECSTASPDSAEARGLAMIAEYNAAIAANAEPPQCGEHEEAQITSDALTWITMDHLAVWTAAKWTRLLKLCRDLQSAKKRRPSSVVTFLAPNRRIPRPDTWGEVALVKAREVAGCWYPTTRFWLKVANHKELLGQAILESNYYRGEDKSDLPQASKRPSIDERKSWWREYEKIP